MTLRLLDFERECQAIANAAANVGEAWEWIEPKEGDSILTSEPGYLVRTGVFHDVDASVLTAVFEPSVNLAEEDLFEGMELSSEEHTDGLELVHEDVTSESPNKSSTVLVYEYHIVYHSGYSVPVIYFNATTLNGRMVTGDEIWACAKLQCTKTMRTLSAISQAEHPVLHRPFFFLHPCHTATLMASVFSDLHTTTPDDGASTTFVNETAETTSPNYLTAWISLMGPAIGLNLPSCVYSS
eukprot:m.136042 g.136042  ORF g.136042 m.136042 type:complete len:240 (-) comp29830_c0_seq3:333-1052(-)